MVIIGAKCGQLGNRLFVFSHFIANAIEHGYMLFNPSFDEYCSWFPTADANNFHPYRVYTRHKNHLPYPFYKAATRLAAIGFSRSPWHSYVRWSPSEKFRPNDESFLRDAKRRVVLTDGWSFRDFENLAKHAGAVRKLFYPYPDISRRVEEWIERHRCQGETLIGVHLRRGDYRSYAGGRFYYSDAMYKAVMRHIERQLSVRGYAPLFLLCSNEPLDLDAFREFRCVRGTGHIIEDLYSLSLCKYIVGPPSTYSGWASFFGQVPLKHVTSRQDDLRLETFTVLRG